MDIFEYDKRDLILPREWTLKIYGFATFLFLYFKWIVLFRSDRWSEGGTDSVQDADVGFGRGGRRARPRSRVEASDRADERPEQHQSLEEGRAIGRGCQAAQHQVRRHVSRNHIYTRFFFVHLENSRRFCDFEPQQSQYFLNSNRVK